MPDPGTWSPQVRRSEPLVWPPEERGVGTGAREQRRPGLPSATMSAASQGGLFSFAPSRSWSCRPDLHLQHAENVDSMAMWSPVLLRPQPPTPGLLHGTSRAASPHVRGEALWPHRCPLLATQERTCGASVRLGPRQPSSLRRVMRLQKPGREPQQRSLIRVLSSAAHRRGGKGPGCH